MKELAVVGLWCCRGPFPFCRLVRSVHPVDLDPRRMNLSSILRCWSDSRLVCQWGLEWIISCWTCTCPYLSRQVNVEAVENCANVFDVIIIVYTRTTRTKPWYYNRVQLYGWKQYSVKAEANGEEKWIKVKLGEKEMCCWCFFSFFLFFFFNWLVGVTRVWICWQYGLPGIVGLLVGVPGCRRERRWEWIPTCTVWSGWKAMWMMWACTSAPMYFVSAPPKT